jgi:FkbM family methyltransferase
MSAQGTDEYRRADRALAVAAFAQKHLPRGKGAVPRWLGKTIGRHPRFLVTRHGAHLAMASIAWDVYATMALNGGSWDYHDFEWCVNGLPDAGVFYDIGANVGYFSVEMAIRLVGVQVVAFEPQAELAAIITQSASLNRMENVRVVHAMVGNSARQAELYLAPASIHASAVADSGRRSVATVQARMVTVDDLVEAADIPPPDLVKMDVEGSEHLVFVGAARTFRTHRPHIFLEYIADYDPERRVRRQVERLVGDCPDLELFGHAAGGKTSGRPYGWFRIGSEADWLLCDSLFLKNPSRPVRDAGVFEP